MNSSAALMKPTVPDRGGSCRNILIYIRPISLSNCRSILPEREFDQSGLLLSSLARLASAMPADLIASVDCSGAPNQRKPEDWSGHYFRQDIIWEFL